MLIIYYPNETPLLNEWKEKLADTSVGFNFEKKPDLPCPLLVFGSDRIEGNDKINAYLEDLKDFADKWYECRCDKWDSL